MKSCKEHIDNPVRGYNACPGCEVQMLRAEVERLQADNGSLRGSTKRMGEDASKAQKQARKAQREIDQLKAENQALRSGSPISRLTCAEVREAFNQAYYQPREIGSDGEQCRAGVLAVIEAAMAKEASHD